RIDLGGAAGRVEYERPPEVPLHRPPQDTLPWPTNANPGGVAPGINTPAGSGTTFGANPPGTGNSTPASGADALGQTTARPQDAGSSGSGSNSADAASLARLGAGPSAAAQAPSEVTLDLGHQSIRRGHPLR